MPQKNRVRYETKNITGKTNRELNIEALVEELRTTFLCVNGKFNIQSIAAGTLTILNTKQFSYEKYDF